MSSKKAKLGPIYLVAFLDLLGFGTIIPVIRDLTESMVNLSGFETTAYATYAGILMASYSLFQFIFAPWLGSLSDKYGRKKLLMVSVLGNVFSYFLWAVSQSFEVFLISRIISGATGGNISIAQSYVVDVTEKKERAKALGMMGALFGLGFILGPYIGGELSTINLRGFKFWIFEMNTFAMIGLFTMGLSLVNLLWIGLAIHEPEKKSSAEKLARKIANPTKLFKQFVRPDMGILFIIYFLISLGFVHLEATLAWELKYEFSLDARETGYFFAYLGVLLFLVQGGLYRGIYKRTGERALARYSLLITAVGLAALPFASSITVMAVITAILAIGMGIGNPSMTTLASFYSKEDEQGFNMGILQSFSSLARVIAPIVATLMYDQVSRNSALFSAASFALAAFFISHKLPKKDSLSAD